jgi:hypothetical protein
VTTFFGDCNDTKMAKNYNLWPSSFADCGNKEKLNLMPFVKEDVNTLGK